MWSPREAGGRLKDEQTSLDPFDDHKTAIHGSHTSVMHNYLWEMEAIDTCCKGILGKFHKFLLQTNTAPNSGKAREVYLSMPPTSLQQTYVLSLGRKSEHFPDPDETVDKNTNHESLEK